MPIRDILDKTLDSDAAYARTVVMNLGVPESDIHHVTVGRVVIDVAVSYKPGMDIEVDVDPRTGDVHTTNGQGVRVRVFELRDIARGYEFPCWHKMKGWGKEER
jgi:hypothetical protein